MVKRQRTAIHDLHQSHAHLLQHCERALTITPNDGVLATSISIAQNIKRDFERAFNINPPPREPVDPPSVSSVTSVAALPSHQLSQDFATPTQS